MSCLLALTKERVSGFLRVLLILQIKRARLSPRPSNLQLHQTARSPQSPPGVGFGAVYPCRAYTFTFFAFPFLSGVVNGFPLLSSASTFSL